MSGIKRPTEKHLMVCTGRAFPELAEQVAALLGVELVPTRALTYANSEIYVRFEESVRGSDCFVIQSHPAPVNEWLMEQLIMIDALKRASAQAHHRGLPVLPATHGRTRSMPGASRSRPGWWPTSTRPPAPTG